MKWEVCEMSEIKLLVKKPKFKRRQNSDLVRISAEAKNTLAELAEKTGLPMAKIASSLIVQGAEFVSVVYVENK